MDPVLRFVAALTSDEPVSIDEAKTQCRRDLDFTDDDLWFERAIEAARQLVEASTGVRCLTGRFEVQAAGWACEAIRCPKAPLVSVESVTYVDTAGVTQTLATSQYVVMPSALGPPPTVGWIERAYGATWPSVRGQGNAVKVTFTAGYGTAAGSVPAALRQAMLLLIGHWYEARGAVVVGTISKEVELAYTSLVDHWRVYPLPVLV